MDVKFLTLEDSNGKRVRRFQYTAIDDATRVRALKIYKRHNQHNAIDFIGLLKRIRVLDMYTLNPDLLSSMEK